MNKQALFHQSDSTLAFPIDESTIKIRLKADKNDNFDYVYINMVANMMVMLVNIKS